MTMIPETELIFSFARSSGAGGQNVNKVNSKATLHWKIRESTAITITVRERFIRLFGSYLNSESEVVIISQEHRSQKDNIDECLSKLQAMITQAKIVPKIRRKTKPTRGAVEKRLKSKKKDGEKKRNRKVDY